MITSQLCYIIDDEGSLEHNSIYDEPPQGEAVFVASAR